MSSLKILQGTDGIRGRITRENPKEHGENALQYFLEEGFLTPSFFEHYAYAYGTLLLETGNANEGDSIVIGWDPRDITGAFNEAAVSGIRKSGLTAVTVGILPTPAIPLYMLQTGAAGSVVLTASHNPSDQNGIKLFHGWTALKFLPADDIRLSSIIFQQQDLDLDALDRSGGLEDKSAAAKAFFISYQTDSRNSWIDGQSFEDQIVVIDASKGAVGTVVQEIFGQYRFLEVIYTNLSGSINESCGVADLEGQELIFSADIINENSRFHSYETLRMMMDTASSRADIRSGQVRLTGLVFDGDGDRCFMLDYDHEENAIVVSSGDQLGIHLARYSRDQEDAVSSWFINTVESDLKTAITAEEEGFQSIITGVGDKWILKQAVLDQIRSELGTEKKSADQLRRILENEASGSELSGLDLSRAWKTYRSTVPGASPSADYRFKVGIEESGHSISPGFIRSSGQPLRCFAGNGIKSALNALVAVQWAARGQSAAERIAWLKQPFQAGIKKTSYVYYVNKEKLNPGSLFRSELESEIAAAISDVFVKDFTSEQIRFLEEAGLVYFRISRSGKTAAAIFVRNSGTEDKSALYLRGEPEIGAYLDSIALRLHLFLLKGMKKQEDNFISLEKELLETIDKGQEINDLRGRYPSLPFDRVLKEVEFKEGLIARTEGQLKLTKKGKLLNDYWEAHQ